MTFPIEFTRPKNDAELDFIINSINNAYGKYFDFRVSEKRSKKLRDCICEGLGYTNGGYQQLKSEWESPAVSVYDFSLAKNVDGIASEFWGGYGFVIAKPLASAVANLFCRHYPQNKHGFVHSNSDNANYPGLSNEELINAPVPQGYGWALNTLEGDRKSEHHLKSCKDTGQWFEVFYGTAVIGYAFKKHYATILNAMLLSLYQQQELHYFFDAYIIENPQHDWAQYVFSIDGLKPQVKKFKINVELKITGSSFGLLFQGDSASFYSSSVLLTSDGEFPVFLQRQGDGLFGLEGFSFEHVVVTHAEPMSLCDQSGDFVFTSGGLVLSRGADLMSENGLVSFPVKNKTDSFTLK